VRRHVCRSASELDLNRCQDRAPIPEDLHHWSEGGLVRREQSGLTSKPSRNLLHLRAYACSEKRSQPAVVRAASANSASLEFDRARERELGLDRSPREHHGAADSVRAGAVSGGPSWQQGGSLPLPAAGQVCGLDRCGRQRANRRRSTCGKSTGGVGRCRRSEGPSGRGRDRKETHRQSDTSGGLAKCQGHAATTIR